MMRDFTIFFLTIIVILSIVILVIIVIIYFIIMLGIDIERWTLSIKHATFSLSRI